jgi:hypothetical protein
MSSWVGPVTRVAYRLDDWDTVTRELIVEGWSVRLAGFPALEANTVVVTGSNQRRMILLVVPPGTPGGAARAVLRSAAGADTMASVEEILASNGIRLGGCDDEADRVGSSWVSTAGYDNPVEGQGRRA